LEGADSPAALEQVSGLVRQRAGRWSMWTTGLVGSARKLKPHIESDGAAIAARLGVAPEQVGVERPPPRGAWGETGRQEGIGFMPVALLQQP